MRIGGPAAGDRALEDERRPDRAHGCSARSTTARWASRPGARTSPARRTSTATSARPGRRRRSERRYGITAGGAGYLWHTTDTRFNADLEPNEPNRFGWVVEIDPFDPHSTPVKRTALGRLKHEGAWVQEARDGRVVVYMGDDEVFEYIYRYVSRLPWRKRAAHGHQPARRRHAVRRQVHMPDGTASGCRSTPDNPALAGWTLNDILINTRGAADAVGATKMDRPEWIDTFPEALTAIATLTNNSAARRRAARIRARCCRTIRSTRQSARANTLRPDHSRGTTATTSREPTFGWEIFALGGDPADARAHGSTIVGDKYGSPDGIYVAPSGRLWIQTDVSGSTINTGAYAGFGNNQMLCADPTTRRDPALPGRGRTSARSRASS